MPIEPPRHRGQIGEDVAEEVLGDDQRRRRPAAAPRRSAQESTSWVELDAFRILGTARVVTSRHVLDVSRTLALSPR